MASSTNFLLTTLALFAFQVIASDPSPLQDFCVADKDSNVNVNGFVCKNPEDVKAGDFFLAANLAKARHTTINKVGSNVTLINVMRIPGLNTHALTTLH
ncbi:hypothetical protein QOZ80_8BG0647420 [Eleusine coracana subsp. coracana]|nr:hypothetical protein QOZ80_8BG0647420 [Eleusine coracana subsp. coracana]